ncbi:hypothetical protein EEL32_08675 [Brevibacillus laterosporus]|nr:hypothetical protein [Brevibacillus laterosporus]TPG88679.1 hypothetical protein EEL32_08675 [Brevibacillus laterosporus]
MTVLHSKHFKQVDNVLKKFSPDTDKDSSSFTVSLPWGISWSFEAGGKISLTVDGKYSDGDVKWNVKTHWSKLSLPDIFLTLSYFVYHLHS